MAHLPIVEKIVREKMIKSVDSCIASNVRDYALASITEFTSEAVAVFMDLHPSIQELYDNR